jgi:hypothetical protein
MPPANAGGFLVVSNQINRMQRNLLSRLKLRTIGRAVLRPEECYWLRWLACYEAFQMPVLLQAYYSWRDQMLTPAQMRSHGISQGLPFLAHGGMWSDATLFAALMATIINAYGNQWKLLQCGVALSIGLAGSSIMHWGVYADNVLPETHVRDGAITTPGIVHFFYMAAGIAVTILFYTCTARLTRKAALSVSALILTHVVIGTHVPLRIWAKLVRPGWYPEQSVFDSTNAVTIVGIFGALCAGSMWALRSNSLPPIDKK